MKIITFKNLLTLLTFTFFSASFAQVGVGNTSPISDLSVSGNTVIGNSYATANAAPTNGLRVQGQTVVGKNSGEDSRDIFSAHTSNTSFNNVTGYGGDTADRAIAGYADGDGIGVFGYATRTGYGVVGLAHANTISSFVQQGEGVLGQADGRSGASSIPIGVHGIIDESASGDDTATPVLGENNNPTRGSGLGGGAYNSSSNSVAAVYGNFATRSTPASTNSYQFGVIGDILLLGVGSQPDATGGVLGTNASGDYGILGYKSGAGILYSGYFATLGAFSTTGTDRSAETNEANNRIGLGVHGGFMGGYVKGHKYGLLSKGEEFGMYVQGKTIANEPILQLIDNGSNQRTVAYTNVSTSIDVNTRGNGKLVNGKAFVAFDKNFQNLVAKGNIHINLTPYGATKGLYISSVTQTGFYVQENLDGRSNVDFNWTAIGTRKGYESGIKVDPSVLSSDFDTNISKVMNSDQEKEDNASMYHDGTRLRFERMPEGLIKYNQKKAAPKKGNSVK